MFFGYVKEFLNDMRIELKSERTVESYRESLASFRQFISDQYAKDVDAITMNFVTDSIVREYISSVVKSNSIGTRNVRLSAIKAYTRYIANKNIELASLCISLTSLKSKTIHPKKHNWLDKRQVMLLLEQPYSTKIGIRDRFLMLFFFSTGARLNELIAVKLNDIVLDAESPYVRLRGKGEKPRIVPFSDGAFLDNYRYYCELYHAVPSPETNLFYTTIRGQRGEMSEDNIQRIVRKYGDAARKIDKTMPPVHPHLLRHSYGAQLYRLGLSLPEIAKLLGHEDISTTEIYAETDVEMIGNALKKAMPNQPVNKWEGLTEDEKLRVLGLKR